VTILHSRIQDLSDEKPMKNACSQQNKKSASRLHAIGTNFWFNHRFRTVIHIVELDPTITLPQVCLNEIVHTSNVQELQTASIESDPVAGEYKQRMQYAST
jgi:hypothetical protein